MEMDRPRGPGSTPESFIGPGQEFSFKIPEIHEKEFQKELRVIIRHPWCIGIPVPLKMMSREMQDMWKGYEIFAVPTGLMK